MPWCVIARQSIRGAKCGRILIWKGVAAEAFLASVAVVVEKSERMRPGRVRRQAAVVGVLAVAAPFACAPEFDATRTATPTGTTGQALFGVICDRVGGQALPEDLTGASFQAVCHPAPDGTYADAVNQAQLPTPQATTTASGQPVSLAEAQATRAHAVARIGALAHDRASLIAAFDATLPAVQVKIRDTSNSHPNRTCQFPAGNPTDSLADQLADMLARFTPLYADGTVPQSTEAIARAFDAFQASDDALAAYARFDARAGYRPLAVTLGAIRPVLAYPELRDFANATLAILSASSNPYAPSATATPGAAYPALTTLLDATYQELRTATGDGAVPPLLSSGVDPLGRAVLSRPRTDLEFMQQLFYAESPAFGGGASRYIVRRDARGYAQVALDGSGAIPSPFLDDGGYAKVNALGQFVTSTGEPAPSPFLAPDGVAASAYDPFGRALTGPSGQLVYDYIDTSHTYAASLMGDLKGLVVPDPSAGKETLMNALAGAYVLAGPRSSMGSTKQYPADPTASQIWSLTNTGSPPPGLDTQPVTLAYSGFAAQSSALLDMVYGMMQVMPGPANDDLLAYVNALLANDTNEVARLIGTGLVMKANADKATTAHIPSTSTLWDEMLDVAVQIEQEPGLLEDVLAALGDDRTPGLGQAFSSYTSFDDQMTYDRNNLNGPAYNQTTSGEAPMQTPVDRSKADTGYNRSGFQRFLQIIHDADGVTVCNKDGATVDAQVTVLGLNVSVTMPTDDPCDNDFTAGTYPECGVFKISNAAAFYLDSIIGKASLYLRDDELRDGIGTDGLLCPDLGLEAATVGLMTQSSGISGTAGGWSAFWDPSTSSTLRPTPQFLNRQLFFDIANDSTNAMTQKFLSDLDGTQVGTSVCPERVITDPDPTAPDASPDGLVHGLRSCADGDWLYERDNDTIFMGEDFNFYASITPLVTAFANHNREDLLIAVLEVLDRHWADSKGTPDECLLSSDPTSPYKTCSQDGAVTYEPLLVQQYVTDILPALHDLSKTLQTLTIPHCDAIDPASHACTPTTVTGISVLAQATRQLLDPKLAAARGLKDRQGKVTALRNDGTTNPQVTPIYLVLEALNNMDAAFATYAAAHPNDTQRLTAWRAARSKLVDQFLTIHGSGSASSFADASVPSILPVLVGTLREQIVAHCPASFSPPYPACDWVTTELLGNMQASMQGPTFAALMGLGDAIRQSEQGRTELEALLTYLLDAGSSNDALPALLGSADDIIQVLRDDTNLVPFYHVAAEAARSSVVSPQGTVVQKGLTQATTDLLWRLTGRVYAQAAQGPAFEDCSQEIDPNQVLTIALQNLVTPMTGPGALKGETPLQVIVDSIADVNRATPESATKLSPTDYLSIASNVSDFMSSPTSGLEQFYAIIRQGTE